MSDDGYEERGFLQRYGFALGIGGVVAIVGVILVTQVGKSSGGGPPPRQQEVVMVRPLPPPPPPPKPPEPPKEIEQKMIEQTPVDQPEPKPDNAPKAAPAPISTGVTGPGNDAFGLGGGGGGSGGQGGGRRGGSHFGWYAGEVQRSIQDALSRNAVTRQAQFGLRVRIWADASGRIVRVRLGGSTGDTSLDRAIEEALSGVQLQDAPPSDMPMPIVMRLEARRPST